MSTLNPSPYAEHRGHRFNLSGTHRGNRYCLVCEVPVGVPDLDEAQASASVPVVAVVTGEGVNLVAAMMRLRGYRLWAQTGMALTRNMRPSVRAWNDWTGSTCRTRADVFASADAMIKEIEAARKLGA